MPQPFCLRSRWYIPLLPVLLVGCAHTTAGPVKRARGTEAWSWRMSADDGGPSRSASKGDPRAEEEPGLETAPPSKETEVPSETAADSNAEMTMEPMQLAKPRVAKPRRQPEPTRDKFEEDEYLNDLLGKGRGAARPAANKPASDGGEFAIDDSREESEADKKAREESERARDLARARAAGEAAVARHQARLAAELRARKKATARTSPATRRAKRSGRVREPEGDEEGAVAERIGPSKRDRDRDGPRDLDRGRDDDGMGDEMDEIDDVDEVDELGDEMGDEERAVAEDDQERPTRSKKVRRKKTREPQARAKKPRKKRARSVIADDVEGFIDEDTGEFEPVPSSSRTARKSKRGKARPSKSKRAARSASRRSRKRSRDRDD